MFSDLNGLSHGRYIPERRLDEHVHHAVTTLTMSIGREILPVQRVRRRRRLPRPHHGAVARDTSAGLGAGHRRGPRATSSSTANRCRSTRGARSSAPSRPGVRSATSRSSASRSSSTCSAPTPDAPGGFGALHNPTHRVYGVGLGGDNTGRDARPVRRCRAVRARSGGGERRVPPRSDRAEHALRPRARCGGSGRSSRKDLIHELARREGSARIDVPRATDRRLRRQRAPRQLLAGPRRRRTQRLRRPGVRARPVQHRPAVPRRAARPPRGDRRDVRAVGQQLQAADARHIAGYWANWGLDNRISTYRVPCERGEATRIENRMPCASASPYLAAAVMLNAALLGVVDGLDCGDPADRRLRQRAEHGSAHAAHARRCARRVRSRHRALRGARRGPRPLLPRAAPRRAGEVRGERAGLGSRRRVRVGAGDVPAPLLTPGEVSAADVSRRGGAGGA